MKTARRHARVPSTAKRNVGCKDDPELSIKSNGPGEESACLDDEPSFMSAGISLRWKAVEGGHGLWESAGNLRLRGGLAYIASRVSWVGSEGRIILRLVGPGGLIVV